MSVPFYYNPVQRLELTFAALGIPLIGDSYDGTTISVQYAPTATQAQIDQGNQLLATWDYRTYRSRLIGDLINALNALTATQKQEIWTDLTSGTPPKVLTDLGGNNAALYVLKWAAGTGMASGDIAQAKLYAAAMYVQDNPAYLINPTFDTSINVPGWEPVV